MAHITLSIPDEAYTEMKKHSEIKWSEIARQSILEKLDMLHNTMSAHAFYSLLSPVAQKKIAETPEKEWVSFTKKMKEHRWKRTKYLTQA